MKRFLSIVGGTFVMLAVALTFAFVSMRVAIHGREVVVPNLQGKADADAAKAAKDLGLNLSVENRFYSSSVVPNSVLSQSPAAGSRVRRGWQVRVTESLGAQRVSVPDVTGQTERPASLMLRRLQLDVGPIARLPAPSPAGIVLAQSPPPNSVGLNGPRVALLVSEDQPVAGGSAYVMPSIVGMTLAAASARLGSAGLHIASAQQPEVVAEVPAAAAESSTAGTTAGTPIAPVASSVVGLAVAPAVDPITTSSVISSQSPPPGHRVTRADAIRVTLGR
jgi:beta-lactam-binding protein with PASTA domain